MIVIHKNSQNQKIDGIIRNGIGSIISGIWRKKSKAKKNRLQASYLP
jgi:hypothetical protein